MASNTTNHASLTTANDNATPSSSSSGTVAFCKKNSNVAFEWHITHELSYAMNNSNAGSHGSLVDETEATKPTNVCFYCSSTTKCTGALAATDTPNIQQQEQQPLLRCGLCKVATYCSKECQINDWKQRPNPTQHQNQTSNDLRPHKVACPSYARIGQHMVLENNELKEEIRNEILQKVRYYICPYAVFKSVTLGKGFLFIQSQNTLAIMSLLNPIDSYGYRLRQSRSLLIHYLTVAEYDMEVCRDDFEMTIVRKELHNAVNQYDIQTHVVVLMRFRCGHIALGTLSLLPEYNVCKKLGHDYFASSANTDALQLNLDDI